MLFVKKFGDEIITNHRQEVAITYGCVFNLGDVDFIISFLFFLLLLEFVY
jgi:hypothetical protein